MADNSSIVQRGPPGREPGPHVRGPIGSVESPWPMAIGFCRVCGANARNTTVVRGEFNCQRCYFAWWDFRVGEQTRSFEDYFSQA